MGMYDDIELGGALGGAAQGFIKGIERAQDLNYRDMETRAKAESQRYERERQEKADQLQQKHMQDALAQRKRAQLLDLATKGYLVPQGADIDTMDLSQLKMNPEWVNAQERIASGRAQAIAGARPATVDEHNVAGYTRRLEGAEDKLQGLLSQGFDPTSLKAQAQGSLLIGPLEYFKGADQKLYEQIVRDFAAAVLRKESGAAISKSEFESTNKQYFPQAGDTPDVLAAKAASRAQTASNFRAQAGKAYAKTPLVKSGKVSPGLLKPQAQAKPKTVIQNGVTYTLNPQTNEYE